MRTDPARSVLESKQASIVDQVDRVLRKFQNKDLKLISKNSWFIVIYFAVLANAFYMFTTFATDLLIKRYGFTFQQSKNCVSLLPVLNMILIPLFSFILSRIGWKSIVMLFASIVCILNYIWMSTFDENIPDSILPYLGVSGVAIFWCLQTSSMWSCLSITLPTQAVSVMIGIATVLQNLIGFIMPLVFGTIQKNQDFHSYQISFYLLSGMGALSLVFSGMLIWEDFNTDRKFHLPENHQYVKSIRVKLINDFEASANQDTKKKRKQAESSKENHHEVQEPLIRSEIN